MAKKVLIVSKTSLEIEQLFNMAQNVCHYRCSHLKAEIISSLMMIRHIDIRKLEAEAENYNTTDCDQFNNH